MSPQAGWILQEEIVPRLRSAIPKSVLCVGAEDPQELIADATVMAARMIDRVESQGKLGEITASNIAYYTIQHAKSGRRANGSSTVDVMASRTQLNSSTRLHSLSEVVSESECGFEIFELQDVISNDREDPGTIAARNLDWQTFTASLNQLELLLIECLVSGLGIREAAELAHVSYWTMREYRKKIAAKALEFMGAEVLADIVREPGWRISLDCERDAQACRNERRAVATVN